MEQPITFGVWLKQRRKALDLTQDSLARRIGCARVTLQKIEAGERRPSRRLAARLAELLELPTEEHAGFISVARGELGTHRLSPPGACTCRHALLSPLRAYLISPPESTEDLGVQPRSTLPSVDRRSATLPSQLTPLIGRVDEVAVACALLRRAYVRLVTLTGPGGTGKTRLGLQVAAELQHDFADGVVFVDLSPIGDPALVAATIATAVGVGGSPFRASRQSLIASLQAYLREQQLLLILDNFEHVIAAAPLLSGLLKTAPRLKVLVTSRAALHLYGEHEFPVSPLALPDLKCLPPLERLAEYAAVALFRERAQAIRPDFHLTHEDAPAVVAICTRLDGLPLAIELAAARVKLLPPAALMERLDNLLQLLTGGARDLHARHQTLRGTIDWSYRLLDAEEQTLLRRLAVFVGGCSIAAAEAVCNVAGDLQLDMLDGLHSLVDKSLLRQVEEPTGEPRFRMLRTIHAYASEQLERSGEATALWRRHAEYLLALAKTRTPEGPRDRSWLACLEAEHDNLRAVLHWSLNHGSADLGLELAAAVWEFWQQHYYVSEGRRWLELALSRSTPASEISLDNHRAARAHALRGASSLALCEGDSTRAATAAKASLALFSILGDKVGMAWALSDLAAVAGTHGNYTRATVLQEESLALFRAAGYTHGSAWSLNLLGWIAQAQGDSARAVRLFEEGLALFHVLGDADGVAASNMSLGDIAQARGDLARAVAHAEESLALCRASDYKPLIAVSLYRLAKLAHMQGDAVRASALLAESLTIYHELDHKGGIAAALNLRAQITLAQGDSPRAAVADAENARTA